MFVFDKTGLAVPEIFFPNNAINLKKWSIIACDQFTSNKLYWENVKKYVGNSPSSLNLIIPEAYLEDSSINERFKSIKNSAINYIKSKIIRNIGPCFILIKRSTSSGCNRWGLLAAIDLDSFDFSIGSKSLIRPSEKTIEERLPPRIKIRENSPIELSHAIVLFNDPGKTVLEPLKQSIKKYKKLYDFKLMKGSRRITGYKIEDVETLKNIAGSLLKTKNPDAPLFIVGDGNHSLSSAKRVWENIKARTVDKKSLEIHPAKYALAEIINIFDPGLDIHPIHRLLINCKPEMFKQELIKNGFTIERVKNFRDYKYRYGNADFISFFISSKQEKFAAFKTSIKKEIPAEIIDEIINKFSAQNPGTKIDYIHGESNTIKLGNQKENLGIILPEIEPGLIFKKVKESGVLPRKSFSIGEDVDKRFYIEGRLISPDSEK